jgi:DNA-binding PadR family transcriptional regulator
MSKPYRRLLLYRSHSHCDHARGDRAEPGEGRRHARGFGFGRGFGRHGGGGRHGLRGRVFERGDLRFVLLHLISEKPRHGYELITAIEEQLGGTYSPSPGVIYPTLTLLEELGYIRPESGDGTKKLYLVTEDGTAFLATNRAQVDAILARMAEVGRAYGGGPAPEIVRAMENLHSALSIRLGRGPLTAEQVRAVTTTLDRAAGEIERS